MAHLISLMGSNLSGILTTIFDFVKNVLSWILEYFFSFIPKLIYTITLGFFSILDFFQVLFTTLTGTGEFSFGSDYTVTIDPATGKLLLNGVENAFSGDPILYFLTRPTVVTIFWSMVALAIVLLIVFTFIAIIKSEYSVSDGKNPVPNAKWPIIRNSIMALIYGFTVPVVALIGIMMSNVLLRSLDDATSANSSDLVSRQLFAAAYYNANRLRSDDLFIDSFDDSLNNYWKTEAAGLSDDEKTEQWANEVDNAFANCLAPTGYLGYINPDVGNAYFDDFAIKEALANAFSLGGNQLFEGTSFLLGFSIYNVTMVSFYYNLWDLTSVLISWIGAIFLIVCFFKVAFAMIQRFFYITMLFVLFPLAISMYPLDPEVFKRWKSAFIKQVTLAYAVVVSLNFYFILMPILSRIDLFGDATLLTSFDGMISQLNVATAATILILFVPFFNALFRILIMIAGAFVLQKAPGYFGNIFGLAGDKDDALSVGGGLMKESVGAVMKVATAVGGVAGKGALAIANARKTKSIANLAANKNLADKAKGAHDKPIADAPKDGGGDAGGGAPEENNEQTGTPNIPTPNAPKGGSSTAGGKDDGKGGGSKDAAKAAGKDDKKGGDDKSSGGDKKAATRPNALSRAASTGLSAVKGLLAFGALFGLGAYDEKNQKFVGLTDSFSSNYAKDAKGGDLLKTINDDVEKNKQAINKLEIDNIDDEKLKTGLESAKNDLAAKATEMSRQERKHAQEEISRMEAAMNEKIRRETTKARKDSKKN